jgi:hypothetical protein
MGSLHDTLISRTKLAEHLLLESFVIGGIPRACQALGHSILTPPAISLITCSETRTVLGITFNVEGGS